MSIRVLIGGMKEESNTFVPFQASLRDFREGLYWAEGDELLSAFEGRRLEISGFLDAVRPAGWEIIPTVAAEAVPSGPVEHEALAWFMERWLSALERAGPVQAVLLCLHGATVTDKSSDASGDILAAIRQRVGPDVFIGATLDLHAHITRKMVHSANVLYGYHTYPHVDQYEVGRHVAQLALAWVREGLRPAMEMCKVPMLLSPAAQSTSCGPFAELMREAMRLESQPGILGASLFPVQPWLDIPELGFAAVVITAGDASQAKREAERLGRLAWDKRHDFDLHLPHAEEAVQQALAIEGGPVILADLGDGPGGGAGGDSTAILRALLDVPAGHMGTVLLTLTDAEAVEAAQAAGLGQSITVSVGGKVTKGFFEPVRVTGTVTYLGEPSYHAYKAETSMGPTAVLSAGAIQLVLTQKPVLTVTPHPYEAVGLDPRQAKIVVVKSSAQFREYFEPFARHIILANTPGPTSSDFLSLPFTALTHPMYPWEDWDWRP